MHLFTRRTFTVIAAAVALVLSGIGPATAAIPFQNSYLYVAGYYCCANREASNIFVYQIDNQANADNSEVACVQEHVYPNWPSKTGNFFDMYKCAVGNAFHTLNGADVDQAYCWVNGGTTYFSCAEDYYGNPQISASRGRQPALSPGGPQIRSTRAPAPEADSTLTNPTAAATLSASDISLVSKAITPLHNIGRSYGADPSLARATPIGPGRARVWLVPGSSGACLVNLEARQATGSTCNDAAAVKAGELWTLDTMPYGSGGAATQVLLGAAPNGDTSATVSWTGGGTTVIPVVNNLYSVPTGAHAGWASVTLTGRSGSRQTVAGIPHLPARHP